MHTLCINNGLVVDPASRTARLASVGVKDGRIAEIDQIETQRLEDDMRRRFERILGKQSDE